LKPCHLISFLGTLHPPNICRANCASLVFFSCRVARSLAPSSLHSASSLGAHSSPGLPSRSRRRHVPLYTAVTATATSRPPLHRGPTRSRRQHVPSLHRGPNPVTASAPLRSRPSAQAGTGHVSTPPPVRRTASPPGPVNGTGLGATHPPGPGACRRPAPRWDRSRPGAMLGPVRLGSLKDVRVTPQCGVDDNRSRHPAAREPGLTRTPADTTHGRFDPRLRSQSKPIVPNVLAKDPPAGAGVKYAGQHRQAAQGAIAQGTWCESHTWRPLSAS
jgi:hypothetical protein